MSMLTSARGCVRVSVYVWLCGWVAVWLCVVNHTGRHSTARSLVCRSQHRVAFLRRILAAVVVSHHVTAHARGNVRVPFAVHATQASCLGFHVLTPHDCGGAGGVLQRRELLAPELRRCSANRDMHGTSPAAHVPTVLLLQQRRVRRCSCTAVVGRDSFAW